jgi:hypothetical protein
MCKPNRVKLTHTDREIREALQKDLRKYEASVGDIAPDERKMLRKWVVSGNSPYENPSHYAGEDGMPMGFIEAMRLESDMLKFPENYCFHSDSQWEFYQFYDLDSCYSEDFLEPEQVIMDIGEVLQLFEGSS